MGIELLVIFILILVNGLLAGSEIAIVSVRSTRLKELLAEGRAGAAAVARLRANPERFLATVQVGITVVGATAAAFGGASFAEDLVPFVERVEALRPHAAPIALALVVTLISYLSVVIGELVPKSLALRVSVPYALVAGKPLLALAAIASPAVWLLTLSSNLILKLFGDTTSFTEGRVSIQELQEVVGQATRAGSIDAGTAELASRAIDMSDLTAEDVMVHRRFVVMLPETADSEALRDVLLRTTHRRIPIHGGSPDDIKGYVSWRDVVGCVWNGKEPVVAELLRPAHFVPQTRTAVSLLREMREKRIHLSIVLDEHGGMAGIVTLEDLLEEIVGDIKDEHDGRGAAPPPAPPDGALPFAGPTPVRDVERVLGMDLEDLAEGASTIGGLAIALAGDRIPVTGELLVGGGLEIEILDASPRRIRSLAIRRVD